MGGMEFGKPRALKEEEIEGLVEAWARGAEVLYKAGADGCQLRESRSQAGIRSRAVVLISILDCPGYNVFSHPIRYTRYHVSSGLAPPGPTRRRRPWLPTLPIPLFPSQQED